MKKINTFLGVCAIILLIFLLIFYFNFSERVSLSPTCGDGICEIGESKENCSEDCGFCPTVAFDANNNLVVDGEIVFPIGFWGFYWAAPENWTKFDGHFNTIVGSPYGEVFNSSVLEDHELYLFDQVSGRADYVVRDYNNSRIIGWEVLHEPFSYDGSIEDLINRTIEQAINISEADPCHRPVFITPSAGSISYLANVSNYFNLTFTQSAYGVPRLPIYSVGLHINSTSSYFGGKPVFMVMSIGGYQSSRYRRSFREPTFDEMRAQSYDAIVHGAKGIVMYNFDKGSADTNVSFEPANSDYDLEDEYSSGHYQNVRDLADDLNNRNGIFRLPFAEDLRVNTSNEYVRCGIWKSSKHIMICVNVDQSHSDYFEYGGGETVYRPRAYVNTIEGYAFPDVSKFENATFYDLLLEEDLVLGVQSIFTGVTSYNYSLNETRITILQAPVGANLSFAIYTDNFRDSGPDSLIYLSDNYSIETISENNFTFAVNPPLVLERTKNYFLIFRTDSLGVHVSVRDVRNGIRVKDNSTVGGYQPIRNVPLLENYSELHWGKSSSVSIELNESFYSTYCVERDLGGGCDYESFGDRVIQDNFNSYAVHVYYLGESQPNIPPGDGEDDEGDEGDEDNGEEGSPQLPTSGDEGCAELWSCGEWGECNDGIITRECHDLNFCGTSEGKRDVQGFCDEENLFEEQNDNETIESSSRYDLLFAGSIAGFGILGVFTGIAIYFLRERIRRKTEESNS